MNDNASVFHTARTLSDRLSIRQRLIGAVALILGLFALACVTSIATFENVHHARVFVESTNDLLERTSELSETVIRQESALRGYTISGSARYRETLSQMSDQFNRLLTEIEDKTPSSSVQLERLSRLQRLQEQWRRDIAVPIIAEVEAGDLAGARDRLASGVSVAIFDPMRDTLGQFWDQVRHDLGASIAELDHRQQRARWLLIGVLLFGLVVGLLTVRAIVRRVTRPLTWLSDATRRMAAGERDIDIRFLGRADEVGSVSRALERFRQLTLDQDRQAWIRDHRARVTVLMHRFDDANALGDALLSELAPLLGAGYAALFAPASLVEEDSGFSLIASYGYSGDIRTRFRAGEGLVGQVVDSGERIVLDDVPEGYLPVRSGMGAATPRVLLLAPARIGDTVEAVLEVALFRQPSSQALELLETLLPNVALALISLARSRRTADLLEQSRAQTDALRGSEQQLREQREALQQVNAELRAQSEELNAQSEELRASEEELKVQAEELQASNEELRERQETLREQQAELSRLHTEAEERAEALARASQYKSDFLANMSHELRTPLNSLLILSRSLADNDEGNLDAEQIEAAHIIHESGSNLLALINDILDLSKIEAGKMQVNAETVSLPALATRIERHFAHVAERKGLAFSVSLAGELPVTMVTDTVKLEQIVRNLVSNALKFTQVGEVRVEIALPAADAILRSSGLGTDNALAIHVIDQGIGIPADRLEQIFQAFEQVDASTSRTYGGTGLGLSISRELARLLGGEITVASQLGEGSRFSVYVRRDLAGAAVSDEPAIIPAAITEPATAVADPETLAVAGRPRRARPQLLIIDDDAVFTKVVADAARKRGFDCEIAADGERGLTMVRQQLPDAIVLDLGLPGMDGWAVLDRIKASERTRDIPVHIVSAADDPGQRQRGGAVGFLRKPISREGLDVLFARAATLSGREARRVLVIDDDRDAHTAIAHLLKHESVDIVSVTTGEAGMRALDARHFDCVVLDLHLPDTNGFDLLEQIDARAGSPPVVVYSGRELSDEETRRLRAHTDSIVIKGAASHDRLLDEISLFFRRLTDTGSVRAPAPEGARAMDAELAGQTVLLVDDDMRNTFALSRVLRAKGLKVLMAADGFKALDQLEANADVAVVLMDIMMPGMDGYETIRRIRAQARYAELPIIALTAKAMAGDRDKCLAAGANDYLTKPLDTDMLVEHIRALL